PQVYDQRDIWWNIAPDYDLVPANPPFDTRRRKDRAMISKRTWLARTAGAATLLLLAWGAPSQPAKAQSGDVLVFAAASLKTALDAVNGHWTKETGKKATISYAASSALAKQIEHGAPAQMFISADLDWMDYLAGKSL